MSENYEVILWVGSSDIEISSNLFKFITILSKSKYKFRSREPNCQNERILGVTVVGSRDL